jgi:hypothetical protein
MNNLPFTKTRTAVAGELKVTRKTLQRMLDRAGVELPPGPVYLPWQKVIYEMFSYPEGVGPDDYKNIPLPKEKSL